VHRRLRSVRPSLRSGRRQTARSFLASLPPVVDWHRCSQARLFHATDGCQSTNLLFAVPTAFFCADEARGIVGAIYQFRLGVARVLLQSSPFARRSIGKPPLCVSRAWLSRRDRDHIRPRASVESRILSLTPAKPLPHKSATAIRSVTLINPVSMHLAWRQLQRKLRSRIRLQRFRAGWEA